MLKYTFTSLFIVYSAMIFGQVIPYGISVDSVPASDGYIWEMNYYKPTNYDTVNGSIIWAIHGSGAASNGYNDALVNVTGIAERRNALVVAPTFQSYNYPYVLSNEEWLPTIFNELYNHVLSRENRDTMWVHLIGFSGGGQFVTRYMLIRQAIPDHIPIRMAVSSNPYYYTFCTDSLDGVEMLYPCGLSPWMNMDFICNEHVKEYYNENYAVLIGTADIGAAAYWPCEEAQGSNRYERAINFWNFSVLNAIERGTGLKWQYGEVPGVAHNQYLMYNTILAGDSIPLAERFLFESPYYEPVNFPPSAEFSYEIIDTIGCTTLQFNALCNCQDEPTNFLWNFGDGGTINIANPVHTFPDNGTYQVTLHIESSAGSSNSTKSVHVSNELTLTDSIYLNISKKLICPGERTYIYSPDLSDYSEVLNFGDGNTQNNNNYSYRYTSEGTYVVSVTYSRPCYSDTTIYDTVLVQNGLPLTDQLYISGYPSPACPGEFVSFSGYTENTQCLYTWDFGDSTYAPGQYLYHSYDSVGAYYVSLNFEVCGTDTTLYDSVIIQNDAEPYLGGDYWATEYESCVNDTIEFWGRNSGGSYVWDFGNGDTTSLTFETIVTTYYDRLYKVAKYSYSEPGEYTVSFIYTSNCGFFTDSFNISIGSSANADFMVDNSTVCLGDNIDFTSLGGSSLYWDFGDETYDYVMNPSHVYDTTGTFIVTLIDTIARCSDTSSMAINVVDPVAVFMVDKSTVCLGDIINFTSQGGTSLYWDFGDQTYDSIANPTHIYDTTGNFIIKLIDSIELCADESSMAINIVDPVAGFTQNKDTADLFTSGYVLFMDNSTYANSWFWDFGDGETDSLPYPLHIYDSVGSYPVTLIINSSYCSDTAVSVVNVINTAVEYNLLKNECTLSLYPNPSNGLLTLKTSYEAIEKIEVYNSLGVKIDEVCMKNNISTYTYNSKSGMQGLYLIKVTTKSNIYSGKVLFR